MKTCTKCGVSKPLFEFNRNKSLKDGLQSSCKVCKAIYNRSWGQANKERRVESSLKWRKANPEKQRAYNKKWSALNYEKQSPLQKEWRKANPERQKKYRKQWRKTNKNLVYAYNAKRRANKLKAIPPWLSPEHHKEIALCYEEAQALRLYTGQEYHVDHIVPLQGKNVCGLHVPWNLQVILARDNLSKGNKYVDD